MGLRYIRKIFSDYNKAQNFDMPHLNIDKYARAKHSPFYIISTFLKTSIITKFCENATLHRFSLSNTLAMCLQCQQTATTTVCLCKILPLLRTNET